MVGMGIFPSHLWHVLLYKSSGTRPFMQVFLFEQVSEATVTIVERPWERVAVDGKPHSHGEKSFIAYSCCLLVPS